MASGDGAESEGGKGFFVELDSLTFIMVALGGALFLVIILTLAMVAICVWTLLTLKRRVNIRASSEGPTTLPHTDPGTAERGSAQLSPDYNDQDTLTAQPPIPPRTPDRLIPLAVSKTSNETEATFITDITARSDSDFGSVFEGDICPTPVDGSLNAPHRSLSETPDLPLRTEEMHFMISNSPPRTPDRLIPLAVSKTSNETEATFITDITAQSNSDFESVFEGDICPTPVDGSLNAPHRSRSETPDLPLRTEEMRFMISNSLSCRSASVTPEVPPRNEESPEPDMNPTKTLKSSIESLLSEDYDHVNSFLLKKCDESKSTDIHNATKCSLTCKEVVTDDIVTEGSGKGNPDKTNNEAINLPPESSIVEPTVNTPELTPPSLLALSTMPPSPSRSPAIPPKLKSSSTQIRMEASHTSKREPRPPPPVQRVSSDIPAPPIPPKGLAKSGGPETALLIPPRHIKRRGASGRSSAGGDAEDESEDGMFLMFNNSYHTLVKHFYK